MVNIVRIVHPTDFSESSRQAAAYAGLMARQFDAELHILHVIEEAMGRIPEAGMGFPPAGEELSINSDEEDQLLLEGVGLQFSANRSIFLVTRLGPPSDEIVKYAGEKDASVIVMGTHGRRGLAHFVVGSVAEAVVRNATYPVLTIRSAKVADAS